MINKNFPKIFLAAALTVGSLFASDDLFDYKSYSLFGIEAGYGSISSEMTNTNTSPVTFKTNDTQISNVGLKIGAQSENYRVLLSARYAKDFDSTFDYIANYEAEMDYLFNFSRQANFFIGVSTGMVYTKFIMPGEPFSRTTSSAYYGGNAGFNIHMSRLIDLELGGRMMLLNTSNIKSGVEYKLNDIVNGYVSIIFKYQMD